MATLKLRTEIQDPAVGSKVSRARKQPVVADTATGIAVLQEQVRLLTGSPGVYRMLDVNGDVLYVGKAQNLKKRVNSYASPAKLSHRIFRMVSETRSMVVIATHTEVEALLLESNLIKRLKPRYNVLLRDDKSFPHILITEDHGSPRIVKHRGAQNIKGDYYGPFASAGAVNRTVTALQRAFLIRNCSDSIFAARTRPCLQFQIKRCAAPCVGQITDERYREFVDQAKGFLSGRSREVQQDLADSMQSASDALDFEGAALYRDRIRALSAIQAHQDINVEGVKDADLIALHREGGASCVQVFFFRGGGNYGNRPYFPSHDKAMDDGELLAAFIGQFYDNKVPPPLVLTNYSVPESDLIAQALSVKAERRVHLSHPRRGSKRKLIDHAELNAREALGRRVAESASQRRLLEGVAQAFSMESPPDRIEVYDNSHIQGTHSVGAMIVSGAEGFAKSAYRRFNIRNVCAKSDTPGKTPDPVEIDQVVGGDDFAMMRQVLTRRFERALREDPDRAMGTWPELILIDGGAGQLGVAREVLSELSIDDVLAVGVAKGPDRDAGRERFFISNRTPFMLERESPVLYFLQRLRDEAHRFAIEGHRARRTKAITRNVLDDVPGIGAKRKKALLHHFGSGRAVSRAGLADLEEVEGISKAVAKRIYDFFRDAG